MILVDANARYKVTMTRAYRQDRLLQRWAQEPLPWDALEFGALRHCEAKSCKLEPRDDGAMLACSL